MLIVSDRIAVSELPLLGESNVLQCYRAIFVVSIYFLHVTVQHS
jgi:hypothetical protein